MVIGFLGTLIGLERAVALGRSWPYAVPVLTAISAVAVLTGFSAQLSAFLAALAALVMAAVFVALYRQQPSAHFIVMALSALAWVAGNVLWLASSPIFRLVPWWMAFLVLMIAGERLELSRVRQPSAQVQALFHLSLTVVIAGILSSLFAFHFGLRMAGVGLLAIALWLIRYDLAWQSARQSGLPRFMAVCLITGYFGLAAGGILWVLLAQFFSAGPYYDAMLHAIFLGFVFSMIFAHAPIILPTVTGLALPFHNAFYLHAGLLHVSVLLRVAGDLGWWPSLQRWGGMLNVLAILLFLINNLRSIVSVRPTTRSGAMKTSLPLAVVIPLIALLGCDRNSSKQETASQERPEAAAMSFAPAVPPPIARTKPAHVVINLAVSEEERPLADGVTYEFWSYNGHTPGPFIRLRVGDTFEVRLDNSKGKLTHTVDFHAVTGPGGGAGALMTNPGEKSVATFKALNAGLFVYHCAAPPIPAHIANGLYGLVLVEPEKGLPKVDREYYVMQSEFYTAEEIGTPGLATFSSNKGYLEKPEYIVFNGHAQALTGKGSLQARAGDTTRLYVGNIGPNLVSSFHVIGEIFDKVYREGSLANPENDVQTTLIPAGGAAILDFKLQVPGDYVLVDHSIFRTDRGAVGILSVNGDPAPSVFNSHKTSTGFGH
jgi:nitrite reductase (NO-forming)